MRFTPQTFMRGLCAAFALALLSTAAFATPQRPDILIYKGRKYSLNAVPLEEYLEKNPDIKLPPLSETMSSLWRGYIATFKIKNNYLFASDVKIPKHTNGIIRNLTWKRVTNEFFKDPKKKQLDWFSGLLVSYRGKVIKPAHMKYINIYEKYIVLEIDKGKCIKEKYLSGEAYLIFTKNQFEAFKQTDEYKALVKKFIKEGVELKEIDSRLETFITFYTKKILID